MKKEKKGKMIMKKMRNKKNGDGKRMKTKNWKINKMENEKWKQ